MQAPHLRAGRRAEDIALHYLRRRGLVLVARNFRRRCGELDLVMRDAGTLVIAEVRYRRTAAYGGALASIGWRKQQRLARAALMFVQAHRISANVPLRFDVVAVSGEREALAVEWIRDAFHPTP